MKLKIAIILFITIVAVWLSMDKISDGEIFVQTEPQVHATSLPVASNATLEQAIINYSIDNNINYEDSLRIAECESKMGKYKYNLQGSSAYGLYQFMPKTFYSLCQGDIESDLDQIICFTKLYKKYPHYWVCK